MICTIYREFNNLDGNGPLNINTQIERLHTVPYLIDKKAGLKIKVSLLGVVAL